MAETKKNAGKKPRRKQRRRSTAALLLGVKLSGKGFQQAGRGLPAGFPEARTAGKMTVPSAPRYKGHQQDSAGRVRYRG
jgi:hypothetical protein